MECSDLEALELGTEVQSFNACHFNGLSYSNEEMIHHTLVKKEVFHGEGATVRNRTAVQGGMSPQVTKENPGA